MDLSKLISFLSELNEKQKVLRDPLDLQITKVTLECENFNDIIIQDKGVKHEDISDNL